VARLFAIACAWLAASPLAAVPAPPIAVAVSVPPLAYLAERVGGERVRVVAVLVPPGASPETYAPRPRQIVAASRAAVYVAVGHPHFLFERLQAAPLLAPRSDLRVIALWQGGAGQAAGQPPEAGRGEDEDPHVWVAPDQVAAAAPRLAAAFAALDPGHAGFFAANLRRFLADVAELDRSLALLFAPHAGQAFLVAHPAWHYLAAEYGLRQVAIEEGDKPPSPRRLVRLIEEARRRRFPAVFVQPGHSPRSAEVVAREIGARLVWIDPLARDWLANLRAAAAAIAGGLAPPAAAAADGTAGAASRPLPGREGG
jgi:zinc transport system substrate-binding protein